MCSRSIRLCASWAVAAAFIYASLWIMTVNPRIAMVQGCRVVFGSADPLLRDRFAAPARLLRPSSAAILARCTRGSYWWVITETVPRYMLLVT
jgi:hypothetical protein